MVTASLNRLVLTNASLANMDETHQDNELKRNSSLVIEGNKIVWLGETNSTPKEYSKWEVYPLEGRVVTPGLM